MNRAARRSTTLGQALSSVKGAVLTIQLMTRAVHKRGFKFIRSSNGFDLVPITTDATKEEKPATLGIDEAGTADLSPPSP